MKKQIDIFQYPRARVGWNYVGDIASHLGHSHMDIDLVYITKIGELIITDDRLIEILKFLKIPYDYIPPSSSVQFIKALDEEDEGKHE